VCALGEKYLCASLRFERDNKESGVTQLDEVCLCEGADLFCENLVGNLKDDLMWRAKDEKADAPPRQWMSEPLEQRKGMVGQSGAGKLFAYVMASCLEAMLRRLLFQFKYMPTREVMKQRLGAEHHEESSTVMQGTMIWFLINTVVRFCQLSVVF